MSESLRPVETGKGGWGASVLPPPHPPPPPNYAKFYFHELKKKNSVTVNRSLNLALQRTPSFLFNAEFNLNAVNVS